MTLGVARLCVDGEELHDQARCPACASETFAFVTRWVKKAATRRRPPLPRDEPPETVEKIDAYRLLATGVAEAPRTVRVLRNAAVLVASVGLAGWAWARTRQRSEQAHSCARGSRLRGLK